MRILTVLFFMTGASLIRSQGMEWKMTDAEYYQEIVSSGGYVMEAGESKEQVYFLYGYTDTIDLKDQVFYPSFSGSHFIAAYDLKGKMIWARDLGSSYYSPHKELTVSKNGDFYLAREQRYGSIILSKYSADGEQIWKRNYGGSVNDKCSDLYLDKEENIYMTGKFWYSGNYGGVEIRGVENCLFQAKLDPAGNALSVKVIK